MQSQRKKNFYPLIVEDFFFSHMLLIQYFSCVCVCVRGIGGGGGGVGGAYLLSLLGDKFKTNKQTTDVQTKKTKHSCTIGII